MLTIKQGTNLPIVLRLNIDIDGVSKFSAKLHNNSEIKHWTEDDAEIDKNIATLPITETESQAFPSGYAMLDVKFLDDDGQIVFMNSADVLIKYEFDKTEMGGDD